MNFRRTVIDNVLPTAIFAVGVHAGAIGYTDALSALITALVLWAIALAAWTALDYIRHWYGWRGAFLFVIAVAAALTAL